MTGDPKLFDVGEAAQASASRAASANVLRLIATRWGSAASEPGDLASELRRAAKVKGLTSSLAAYLETLARRHDMIARAFRLAVRAANGESVESLAAESLDPPVGPAREGIR